MNDKTAERIANRVYPIRFSAPRGTAKDIALLVGVRTWELEAFARHSRTDRWLEEHGWKIDYRGHGAKSHVPWSISHTNEVPSVNARMSGERCRGSSERKLRTALVDWSVYVAQTLPGTIEGKTARLIDLELRHLVEKIEALAA